MTIDVDIQVQDSQVTITVGGQPVSNAGLGATTSQATVGSQAKAGKGAKGGDGLGPTDPGGGPGGGAMVIGPIVVGGGVPQSAAAGAKAGAAKGGDGLGPTDPGGGPGGGVLVIGPIVIGGQSSGAAGNPPAQPVVNNP